MTTSPKPSWYANDSKPSTKVIIALALLLVAGLFAWTVPQVYEHAAGPTTLPFPTSQLEPSGDQLAAIVAAASIHNPDAAIQRDLEIRYRDFHSFRAHLHNISAQRGWHAHNLDRGQMALVLPEKELPSLEPMVQDPVGWAITHAENKAPPKGSTSADLLNVQLNINITDRVNSSPWGLLITIMIIVGGFAAMGTIVLLGSAARQTMARRRA